MTTWQDYAGSAGAAVAAWKYEGTRGFLTNKVYQGTNGPGYTYTKAGRLSTRTWARGLTTSYTYNNAGELQGADDSDGLLCHGGKFGSRRLLSGDDAGEVEEFVVGRFPLESEAEERAGFFEVAGSEGGAHGEGRISPRRPVVIG